MNKYILKQRYAPEEYHLFDIDHSVIVQRFESTSNKDELELELINYSRLINYLLWGFRRKIQIQNI